MFLHRVLPEPHLRWDSREVVKLAMGLVGTMSALILGLLVSAARSYFDTQGSKLSEMSSKVVLLDHVLAHCGPEADEVRGLLRGSVSDVLRCMWSKRGSAAPPSDGPSGGPELILDRIQELSPNSATQRALESQAVGLTMALGKMRWLQYAQGKGSLSMALPFMLILWLTAIFMSFGLYAPANATVVTSLFVAALSVSRAILLTLEWYTPYRGLIQLSDAPLVTPSYS